jgi:hypothetical protein
MDDQVMDLLELAAGSPPNRITVAAVRRGVIRRRAIEGAAATTAAVLLASLGLAAAAQATGGRPGPAAGAGAAAPAYYYESGFGSGQVIRATATGRVTGHVRCPWRVKGVAAASVAASSDRELYVACDAPAGSRIYRFGLSRAGRVTGYTLVRGGTLTGLSAGNLAVTPGGGEVAVTTASGASAPFSKILVISTRTGARATWTDGPAAGGVTRFGISDLSFARDGRELAFRASPRCLKGAAGAACRAPGIEVRAVSPATAGGPLGHSQVLVRQARLGSKANSYINDAFITPDGSSVIVADLYGETGESGQARVTVQTVSAATGRRTGLLYRQLTGDGWSYRLMSIDPTGRFVLLDAGRSSNTLNGWINHGKLDRLQPAGGNVAAEAW